MKKHSTNKLREFNPKNPTVYLQALLSSSLVNKLRDWFAPQKTTETVLKSLSSWNWRRNVERTFLVTWLKAALRVSSTEEFISKQ